jgi:hypothetical protein
MIMNNQNDTMHLINQARAEARANSVKRFFAKHKKIVTTSLAATAVLLLIFVAASFYQKSAQEKYSAILHQSLIEQENGDVEATKALLKKIYDAKFAPSGVKALASLRYAGLLLAEDNKSAALKIYHEINQTSRYDSYIKELSGLLEARILITDASQTNKDEVLKRIEKIELKSKILHYYISEQKGIFELQNGNLENAYKIFDMITKSPESSQSLKTRAADTLKLVVAKGYEAK